MESKYTRSILDINNGSIVRDLDCELAKVMVNLADVATDDKAREITLKLKFTPKNDKKEMDIKPTITSKLSPKKTEDIHVYNQIKRDENGEVLGFVLQEPSSVLTGQINLNGEIEPPKEPIMIDLKKE